jgi:putative colanic acid biosysnthesis UDP-glucose lipid carrier transferase
MLKMDNNENKGNFKKKQELIDLSGIFLNPLIAYLLLILITIVSGESFDKPHIIVGALAFAFLFPGKSYVGIALYEMINQIIVKWSVVALLIIVIVSLADYDKAIDEDIFLSWLISTPLILITVNCLAQILAQKIFSSKHNLRKVLIVGCTTVGTKLGDNINTNKLTGMNLVGYCDDRSVERISLQKSDLIGKIPDVANYCKHMEIDRIYICIPITCQPRINNLLNDLKDTTVSVYYVPDIFVTDLIQSGISHIDGIPVVAICETPLTGINALQKRLVDIFFATVILVVSSPILVWVSIKIKHSSPGPIIFVQKRYGLDGKGIDVYKFRTMNVTENGISNYKQVQKNDNRVTVFGSFLRKTSLDEFPQFVNVLQGKMSIVGPRPHVVAVNETYRKLIPGYMVRHKVKPGITGWAQVNGFRGGDDLDHMQGRIEYDLDYMRNWSFFLDLWIILKTALLIVQGDKKAY